MSKSTTTRTLTLLMACTLLLTARTASAQEFVLLFRDGLVTLVARDVTVPTILTWWGRLGSATVINGEKVEGPPVTLQLVDVPEREALAILLRNVGGYMLVPRHEDLPGASVFDRVFVVPSSKLPVPSQPPQRVVQSTFTASPPQNLEPEQFFPGQTPDAGPLSSSSGVGPPQRGVPQPGVAPFAAQGAPTGFGNGTARPGEMPAPPPPPSRLSPGPQRPPQ